MKRIIVFFAVLFMSFHVCAEDHSWYLTAGGGTMTVPGVKHSGVEEDLMNDYRTSSVSSVKKTTNYKTLFIGRCVTDRVCFELGYLCCAEFSTDLTVRGFDLGSISIDAGTVNLTGLSSLSVVINGQVVDLSKLPAMFAYDGANIVVDSIPFDLKTRREANLSATQLSMTYSIPVTRALGIFYRVGVYEYRIKVTTKILLPQNIYIGEENEIKDTTPMASMGLDWKISSKYTLRGEYLGTSNIRMVSWSVVYRFK